MPRISHAIVPSDLQGPWAIIAISKTPAPMTWPMKWPIAELTGESPGVKSPGVKSPGVGSPGVGSPGVKSPGQAPSDSLTSPVRLLPSRFRRMERSFAGVHRRSFVLCILLAVGAQVSVDSLAHPPPRSRDNPDPPRISAPTVYSRGRHRALSPFARVSRWIPPNQPGGTAAPWSGPESLLPSLQEARAYLDLARELYRETRVIAVDARRRHWRDHARGDLSRASKSLERARKVHDAQPIRPTYRHRLGGEVVVRSTSARAFAAQDSIRAALRSIRYSTGLLDHKAGT